MLFKNYQQLIKTKERRICLSIMNFLLKILHPSEIIGNLVKLENGEKIIINKNLYDLKNIKNLYLIGIGKGSLLISLELIKKIKSINESYVIDLIKKNNKGIINFTQGTHPLPSKINFNFTKKILDRFYNKVSKDDMIFVIVCGGGSAMLIYPHKISLDKYICINRQLLKSGANIYEMNILRKHLDSIKGGGLAKFLYPAKIVSLIFSDVPEDDLSFIASGPTVKDKTTINDALKIIKKYNIKGIKEKDLVETPKNNKYFINVTNILALNNLLVLKKIKKFIEKKFNLRTKILTNNLRGDVETVAPYIFEEIKKTKTDILLLGGETTVKVIGRGKGGRNQELVLRFLKQLQQLPLLERKKFLIISINSDGWDNTPFAGAIGDYLTLKKAEKMKLNIDKFLVNNNSFNFFKKIGDGIITGRLSLNIADLILVFKNK